MFNFCTIIPEIKFLPMCDHGGPFEISLVDNSYVERRTIISIYVLRTIRQNKYKVLYVFVKKYMFVSTCRYTHIHVCTYTN